MRSSVLFEHKHKNQKEKKVKYLNLHHKSKNKFLKNSFNIKWTKSFNICKWSCIWLHLNYPSVGFYSSCSIYCVVLPRSLIPLSPRQARPHRDHNAIHPRAQLCSWTILPKPTLPTNSRCCGFGHLNPEYLTFLTSYYFLKQFFPKPVPQTLVWLDIFQKETKRLGKKCMLTLLLPFLNIIILGRN